MNDFPDSIINLEDRVSPTVLASIFDCNVSWIYQCAQAGRLPNPVIDYTYKQCIQQYIRHYKTKQDLLIVKEQEANKLREAKLDKDIQFKESKLRAKETLEEKARELKSEGIFSGDDGMPPLLAAKTKQDIRLAVAREQQLWVKSSIERGEYIAVIELMELCEPLIMSIRQSLLSIALESDEAEKQIDLLMSNLHKLGTSMVDQASFDSDNFIDAIMTREIDYTEIDIDSLPEPLL